MGDLRTTKHRKEQEDSARELYKLYPRHVGLRAALKAIRSAIRRVQEQENPPPDPVVYLAKKVKAYAESDLPEARYVPYPATWFNGDRWLDEPDKPQKRKPNRFRDAPREKP